MKRLVALLLLLSLLLPALSSCGPDTPDAILILPGIMGSELFLADDATFDDVSYEKGTKVWLDLDSVSQILSADEHIAMLSYTSGCPIGAAEPLVNELNVRHTYGSLNTYAALYRALYEAFHEICDVILYSYDWRYDPYDSARELDAYLTERGYDRVMLVAHSMGGLVASHFMAMGEEQRDKIHTYLSLGTPYLGSEQAAYVMATGNIDSFFANLLVSGAAKELCPSIDSMYALLPYGYRWRSSLAVYGLTDKTPAASFEEERTLLQSYIDGYVNRLHTKAEERKALLFTEDGQHISTLVNAYYLVGNGEDTVATVNLPARASLGNSFITTDTAKDGDGLVSLYSATVGGTLPADRTFIKGTIGDRSADHGALANGSDETNLDFAVAVLRGEVDAMSGFTLKSLYNIERGAPSFEESQGGTA